MAGNEGWSREFMFRACINPLRCAFRAARKPRVTVHGHPFDACVSPLGPAGKPFCAFAILHRAESRWFAIVANPARRMRRAPGLHAPAYEFARPPCEE